jgi:hypothetical protein
MGGLNFDVDYQQSTKRKLLIHKKAVPHHTERRFSAGRQLSR